MFPLTALLELPRCALLYSGCSPNPELGYSGFLVWKILLQTLFHLALLEDYDTPTHRLTVCCSASELQELIVHLNPDTRGTIFIFSSKIV